MPDAMKERLDVQATALCKELRIVLSTFPQLPFRNSTLRPSSNGLAYYTTLIQEHKKLALPSFLLWVDKFTGDERFWFGFSTGSRNRMDGFLRSLPVGELQPRSTFTSADWQFDRWKKPDEKTLSRPFRENYSGDYYYGMYDWGGHATRTGKRLDLHKAVQFVRSVLERALSQYRPTKFPSKQDDP